MGRRIGAPAHLAGLSEYNQLSSASSSRLIMHDQGNSAGHDHGHVEGVDRPTAGSGATGSAGARTKPTRAPAEITIRATASISTKRRHRPACCWICCSWPQRHKQDTDWEPASITTRLTAPTSITTKATAPAGQLLDFLQLVAPA